MQKQPYSAEKGAYFQSESKPNPNQLDPQSEHECLEDIMKFMARINRTQFKDIGALKSALKGSATNVYLSLLLMIMHEIDPTYDIKSWTDEKFKVFLKRMGYNLKNISHTRFQNMGSPHTYVQSIQIMQWLIKCANTIVMINEQVNNEVIPLQFESKHHQARYLIQEHQRKAFLGQSDERKLEAQLNEIKNELAAENNRLLKNTAKINADISALKAQEPDLKALEIQNSQLQNDLYVQNQEILEIQSNIETTRTETELLRKKYIQIHDEISTITDKMQLLKIQIDQQPLKYEAAQAISQKDYQVTLMIKQHQETLQQENQQLDKLRQIKAETLVKIDQVIQELAKNNIKITNFDIFEKIPYQVQLYESQQDDGNLDFVQFNNFSEDNMLIDLQIAASQSEHRKSIQLYDAVMKRDERSLLHKMIPNYDDLLQQLEITFDQLTNQLNQAKDQQIQYQYQLDEDTKMLEQLTHQQNVLQNEINALNDSTTELKYFAEIQQEQSEKQAQLIRQIEQKQIENKVLAERLELLEVDIINKENLVNQLQLRNEKLVDQIEYKEQQYLREQQEFKEWVTYKIADFMKEVKG